MARDNNNKVNEIDWLENVQQNVQQKEDNGIAPEILSFLDKQLRNEAKIIIKELDLSRKNLQSLLYLSLALKINEIVNGSSGNNLRSTLVSPSNVKNKSTFHFLWFTSITSIFGTLILVVFGMVFSIYIGHQIAQVEHIPKIEWQR